MQLLPNRSWAGGSPGQRSGRCGVLPASRITTKKRNAHRQSVSDGREKSRPGITSVFYQQAGLIVKRLGAGAIILGEYYKKEKVNLWNMTRTVLSYSGTAFRS